MKKNVSLTMNDSHYLLLGIVFIIILLILFYKKSEQINNQEKEYHESVDKNTFILNRKKLFRFLYFYVIPIILPMIINIEDIKPLPILVMAIIYLIVISIRYLFIFNFYHSQIKFHPDKIILSPYSSKKSSFEIYWQNINNVTYNIKFDYIAIETDNNTLAFQGLKIRLYGFDLVENFLNRLEYYLMENQLEIKMVYY